MCVLKLKQNTTWESLESQNVASIVCQMSLESDHEQYFNLLVSQELLTAHPVWIQCQSYPAKTHVLPGYSMGIFSCYIVNAVILVSKNVTTGNDSWEELPRWLFGRAAGENAKARKSKNMN